SSHHCPPAATAPPSLHDALPISSCWKTSSDPPRVPPTTSGSGLRLSKKSRPDDMRVRSGHLQGNLALRVCEPPCGECAVQRQILSPGGYQGEGISVLRSRQKWVPPGACRFCDTLNRRRRSALRRFFACFSGGRAVRIVPAAVLVLLTAQRVQREAAAAVAHPGESLDQAARAEEGAPLHLGLDLVGPGLQLGAQF